MSPVLPTATAYATLEVAPGSLREAVEHGFEERGWKYEPLSQSTPIYRVAIPQYCSAWFAEEAARTHLEAFSRAVFQVAILDFRLVGEEPQYDSEGFTTRGGGKPRRRATISKLLFALAVVFSLAQLFNIPVWLRPPLLPLSISLASVAMMRDPEFHTVHARSNRGKRVAVAIFGSIVAFSVLHGSFWAIHASSLEDVDNVQVLRGVILFAVGISLTYGLYLALRPWSTSARWQLLTVTGALLVSGVPLMTPLGLHILISPLEVPPGELGATPTLSAVIGVSASALLIAFPLISLLGLYGLSSHFKFFSTPDGDQALNVFASVAAALAVLTVGASFGLSALVDAAGKMESSLTAGRAWTLTSDIIYPACVYPAGGGTATPEDAQPSDPPLGVLDPREVVVVRGPDSSVTLIPYETNDEGVATRLATEHQQAVSTLDIRIEKTAPARSSSDSAPEDSDFKPRPCT